VKKEMKMVKSNEEEEMKKKESNMKEENVKEMKKYIFMVYLLY
jgi:hypothetical protein